MHRLVRFVKYVHIGSSKHENQMENYAPYNKMLETCRQVIIILLFLFSHTSKQITDLSNNKTTVIT